MSVVTEFPAIALFGKVNCLHTLTHKTCWFLNVLQLTTDAYTVYCRSTITDSQSNQTPILHKP